MAQAPELEAHAVNVSDADAGHGAEREAVLRRARAAAAEVAYPDFTETVRPSVAQRRPVCAADGCDNPLPPGTRTDREFCSERCAHRERQRRYRAGLAAKGLWPPSRRVS